MVDREKTDVPRRAPPPGTEEFDKYIADQSVAAFDASTGMVFVRVIAAAFCVCFLTGTFAAPTNLGKITICIAYIPMLVEFGSVAFRGKSIYFRTMLGNLNNRKRAKPDERPKD